MSDNEINEDLNFFFYDDEIDALGNNYVLYHYYYHALYAVYIACVVKHLITKSIDYNLK